VRLATALFVGSLAGGLLAGATARAQDVTILDTGEVERPRLNDLGEVVWSKRMGVDNYTIFSNVRSAIVAGGKFRDPDVNDAGEVIWRFGDGGSGPNGVESSVRGVLFTSVGQDPYYDTQRITNDGEVICGRSGGAQTWSDRRGNLPTYGWFDREDEVNDLGEVVVRGYNGPTGETYDIYSTVRGAITSNATWEYNPDINDGGEVVWDQDGEVWSSVRGFVATGVQPSINDLGEIVWTDGGDLYSSERGQLTTGAFDDRQPQLNNAGQVAFLRDDNVALLTSTASPDPTVYESADPSWVVDPANAVGTASSSPFDLAPASGPVLFYQVDDGTGFPPEILLSKGGAGLLIAF